jgi:hypothetical protein
MSGRWKINWPLLIALLAILARVLPTPRTIDDAFITFRYARNLLSGSGFVFNVGQRVLGTTTPLYTLLLAGLAGVVRNGNYPWLALLVNTLADAGTCLLLIPFGKTLTGQRRVGVAAALLWAIAPMSVTFAIGGMETSIFILLLVGTSYLYLQGRTRLAALTAGLLLLTRPDGALLIGPLAIDLVVRCWRTRRFPVAEAGILMATLLPWAVFATLYFGSPIPHSIAAKSLAYRLPAEAALVRLVQHYGTPFFEQDLFGRFWPLAGFILYLTLTLIGALSCVRLNRRAWPILVFPWFYFVAFAVANPLIFRWYLAPPLPFYFLLLLAGLDRMLGDLRAAIRGWRWSLPFSPLAAPVSVFVLLSLHAWTLRPDHGPTEPAPQMAFHQLELYYAAIGRSLAPQVTRDTVFAAGDVGALGYYSNARIIDTVGIVSPEASAYYPLDPALYVINYAIPPKLILDTRPDYVILLEVYGRVGLLPDARFQASYALVQQIDTDIYGSRGLLVYQRRGP